MRALHPREYENHRGIPRPFVVDKYRKFDEMNGFIGVRTRSVNLLYMSLPTYGQRVLGYHLGTQA